MSRNILCVVEFDNYPEQVVDRAIWLAKSCDCKLQLLVCDPMTEGLAEGYLYLLETADILHSVRESHDDVVQKLVARAEAAGLKTAVRFSKSRRIADVVRRAANARRPRFVIKGTHFHTPSERASLAHADWDLIRDLDYPLWFVKPMDWPDKPVIVAAVDPVHANDKPAYLDKRIVKRARKVAERCGGKLVVVHTYQSLDEIGARVTWAVKPKKLPVADLNRKIHAEHARALKILGEATGVAAKDLHLVAGRAHEILPAFARAQGASLVVLGALARSKLKQRIVGSTAARVLDHLPCDVLVAHAKKGA